MNNLLEFLIPGRTLWPSWSGNIVESDTPCPECKAEKTQNLSGTLDPEGSCRFYCKVCKTHFEIQNKDPYIAPKYLDKHNEHQSILPVKNL